MGAWPGRGCSNARPYVSNASARRSALFAAIYVVGEYTPGHSTCSVVNHFMFYSRGQREAYYCVHGGSTFWRGCLFSAKPYSFCLVFSLSIPPRPSRPGKYFLRTVCQNHTWSVRQVPTFLFGKEKRWFGATNSMEVWVSIILCFFGNIC